jgi:DNA polymerase (family 10)
MKEKFGEQKNGKPARSGVVEGVQVDVLATDEEGLGAALCHFTGPAELNVQQRAIARARGFKLNEKGLWRGEVRIAGRTEEEVYAALGMTFILPQMRDDAELEY